MSPNYSSLAFDEIQEPSLEQQANEVIEPHLNVLVNMLHGSVSNSFATSFAATDEVVKIGGRIVISF